MDKRLLCIRLINISYILLIAIGLLMSGYIYGHHRGIEENVEIYYEQVY